MKSQSELSDPEVTRALHELRRNGSDEAFGVIEKWARQRLMPFIKSRLSRALPCDEEDIFYATLFAFFVRVSDFEVLDRDMLFSLLATIAFRDISSQGRRDRAASVGDHAATGGGRQCAAGTVRRGAL